MSIFRDRFCRFNLFLAAGPMLVVLLGFGGCSSKHKLETWHTEKLNNEFTAEMVGEGIRNFSDYLQLEETLFRQLDRKTYSVTPTGPEQILNRYSSGSSADPLYGQEASPDDQFIYLGNLAVMSERSLLKISPEWLLRTRYNPFFPYLEQRLLGWLENHAK